MFLVIFVKSEISLGSSPLVLVPPSFPPLMTNGKSNRRALGERLGCTSTLAAEISKTASGKGEKAGYGSGEFFDVSGALAAASKMPTLRIDGPFGAPAEDVFKHEGGFPISFVCTYGGVED